MAEQAKVTSVEAIEAFRVRLIIYLKKARAAVEEGPTEVNRTRQWLQGEHRRYWEDQVRVRQKKLDRAQSELSNAKISTLQEVSTVQQMMVRKARESLHEAEAKLNMLKKWDRELENRAEPLLRQTTQIQHTLNNDMPKAIAHLAQIVKTLDAYAGIGAPRLMDEPGQSSDQSSPNSDSPDEPQNQTTEGKTS